MKVMDAVKPTRSPEEKKTNTTKPNQTKTMSGVCKRETILEVNQLL